MPAQKDRTAPPKTFREWFAARFSVASRIVAVAGALAGAWGFIVAVGDPDGEHPLSWLMFLGPAAAGAFPTIELAWSRERDLSMASLKQRWFVLPILSTLAAIVLMGATEIALHATGAVAAAQAEDKWHYWIPADGPSTATLPFALLGFVIALLFSLAFFLLILWPLQLVFRPRQAVEENMMDTSKRHLGRNRAALALILLTVLDAFVIATALTFGIVWLAAASIAAGVAMVVAVLFLQRVDKDRRRAAGLPAGVELRRKRRGKYY